MKKNRSTLIQILTILGITLLIYACKKDEAFENLPKVTTSEALINDMNSAIIRGSILLEDGAEITEGGICWSENQFPEITDNKVIIVPGISSDFTCQIDDLSSNLTYFFRAYAINSRGISYGEEISLTLWLNAPDEPVIDVDGNSYSTVKIGNQVWMRENLKTTHYQTGAPVPYISLTDDDKWLTTTSGAYCSYGDDNYNAELYGLLYNWYTIADARNICPVGWRIPTKEDLETLFHYLEGNEVAGARLKNNEGWVASDNALTTAESGFNALPGGIRDMNHIMQREYTRFIDLGLKGNWWTIDDVNPDNGWDYVYSFRLSNDWDGSTLDWYSTVKNCGLSLRCIKI